MPRRVVVVYRPEELGPCWLGRSPPQDRREQLQLHRRPSANLPARPLSSRRQPTADRWLSTSFSRLASCFRLRYVLSIAPPAERERLLDPHHPGRRFPQPAELCQPQQARRPSRRRASWALHGNLVIMRLLLSSVPVIASTFAGCGFFLSGAGLTP